jgi:uncharacterized protein (TIGR00369 family)
MLDGTLFGPGQPCFGCGPDHPIGFRLAFDTVDGSAADGTSRTGTVGAEVVTHFTPTERFQGPPGIMHGGLVATLADEIAAWAIIALLGKFGFTAEMTCKLHKPVRIGTPIVGHGSIVKDARRIVRARARIVQDGMDACTADITFAILDRAAAERMLGGPLPEAWNKFAR